MPSSVDSSNETSPINYWSGVTPTTNISATDLYSGNGIPIVQTEPYLEDSQWIVERPGGGHFSTGQGSRYYSPSFSMDFICTREIRDGVWRVMWEDFSQPDAEFTDYEYNEPFEYGDRWYVVMDSNGGFYPPSYESGQIWYSENNGSDFRLRRNVREDLFGSSNAFRIEWVDDVASLDDGYSEEREEIDTRDITPVISTNIGRVVPLVSIEQEFSGNGDRVASRLHSAGYAYSPYPDGYHMSEMRHDPETDRICYVETDSSCGYELIFSKIDLTNRYLAEKVSRAQRILRDIKQEGSIRLSARCGFHVHVDVSEWGMREIVSAYHLWNYLEDPIFRFSSAFWSSHREEEVGGGYSTPVPKGYNGRSAIARTLSERRDALNFAHILRAKANCRCGASIYEDWENCSCNLAQPTLEFRVFNATLNQRKVKAYLAFCIAFVNMAKNVEHTPETFPEMRWRGTHIKEGIMSGDNFWTWEEATVERLNYVLNQFPLTVAEKSDIQYCLRNSSLEPILDQLD